MFLQSFWKIKKAGCILLAVLILWMTPACDYLDARHMETVDAASIVAGVTAVSLLKVTAAAFGVVIAAGATAKAVDSFQEWLDENGDAESIATWNQAQAEAQSLALNAGFVGSVRNWLQGKLGSLNSGEIADVTVGAGQVITNGVPVENTELYSAFSAGVSLEESDYFYFYHSSICFYPLTLPDLYCVFNQKGQFQIFQVVNGVVDHFALSGSYYFYSLADNLTLQSRSRHGDFCTTSLRGDISFDFDGPYPVFSTIPVIVTDLNTFVGDGALFSSVLSHATATYGLDANEHLATSFGSFSDSNLAKLATVNLTAAGVEKIQAAVDQAVADNTSTGDDGKPLYAPDIAQAVMDAYQQGLEDAAVVNPDVPVDPDRPVDPDDPVVTPGDGILGFLQGLKDSLKTWITAIPDAFSSGISTVRGVLETGWTTLWGRLAGMGDTLTDIWETLTAGFSLVTAGITDIPGTLSGLFENLHEWIMDIPVTVSDAFTNLHDWIMDIPQTLTAGFDAVTDTLLSIPGWLSDLADAIPGVGEITLPITDAIADTLTVDPDAVQEAVAAESAELRDLPFLEQAQDLFDGLSFSAEVTYPKIKMVTPAIIRPYYDRPEIILLDFEDYKTYCQWMRLLLRAALWLAFVWHVVVLITPKLRIS